MKPGLEQPEMPVNASDITLDRAKSSHLAFVFYYPNNGKPRGRIFYNEEALRILSTKVSPPQNNGDFFSEILSLCTKWKGLLDKSIQQRSGSGEKESVLPGFIEVIQSYQKQYEVKGIILSDDFSNTQKQERSYLFVLERTDQGSMHLSRAARNLNLNRREQQIVRLLIRGLGNKEIAHTLGLSLNTVKGYMKFLMRKLAVRSRVEIVSVLLTDSEILKTPFTHPLHHPKLLRHH